MDLVDHRSRRIVAARRLPPLVLGVALAGAAAAFAEPPRLVKDIAPGATPGGQIAGITPCVDQAFFGARPVFDAWREWRTDGTVSGTRIVKDLISASHRTCAGGVVYFATDNVLWRSDGTPGGTSREAVFDEWVDAIRAGGGRLFLMEGHRLRVRGEGEWPVVTEFPSSASPSLSSVDPRGRAFLTVGSSLWTSDGTPSGTGPLRDFSEGAAASFVEVSPFGASTLVVVGRSGNASGGTATRELWVTDGTGAAAVRLRSFAALSALTIAGSRAFFVGGDVADARDLWWTDGTASGTQPVGGLASAPSSLTGVGDRLFFVASERLWTSDGTRTGTRQLSDVRVSSEPSLVDVDGTLFFVGIDARGAELWKSDGTPDGTVFVADVASGAASSGISGAAAWGSLLLFSAADPVHGAQLWRSDGTGAGTFALTEITEASSSFPSALVTRGDEVLFFAGSNVWRSDGTEDGTRPLGSVSVGLCVVPRGLVVSGGSVFVPCSYSYFGSGNTLLSWNGTEFVPLGSWRTLRAPIAYHGGVLFGGSTKSDSELWWSDGTAAGTYRLKDFLGPLLFGSPPRYFAPMGDAIFLVAATPGGPYLWRSDGTSVGTVPLRQLSSTPSGLVTTGRLLYFDQADGQGTSEIWKSDGTEPGTVLVSKLPGTYQITPVGIAGERAVFEEAPQDSARRTLWSSDGTSAGTERLITGVIAPSYVPSGVSLFFVLTDETSGEELWSTDGTARGTHRVADVHPGREGSQPAALFGHEGVLYFIADDGPHGRELWVSDGTPRGTRRLTDIQAGAGSSLVNGFAVARERLFFSANDGVHGAELWSLPLASYRPVDSDDPVPGTPVKR